MSVYKVNEDPADPLHYNKVQKKTHAYTVS